MLSSSRSRAFDRMKDAPEASFGDVGPIGGIGEIADRFGREAAAAQGTGSRLVRSHVLEPHLASPRRARVLLRHACLDWALGEAYDDAALVVTELVTNAVRHAGTPCRVTITLDDDGLRIAVRDQGPLHPALLDAGNPRRCGAGLRVVTTLAQSWGAVPHADGKTVWARFTPRRPPHAV
jgi:anti-sigma regulatory factor (Ser/Thr protein kinase)